MDVAIAVMDVTAVIAVIPVSAVEGAPVVVDAPVAEAAADAEAVGAAIVERYSFKGTPAISSRGSSSFDKT